jgi:predicted NAD/FAD-dependent oxidoreductase
MGALGRDLARGLDVEYRHRVDRVERDGAGWRLASDTGLRTYGFDSVVIAVPAPQALPLLAAEPDLQAAVAGVGMQPCQAAMLGFERPLPAGFAGAFVEDSPLAWVARDSAKPQRPEAECWVLHATPEWSRSHHGEPAREVLAALLRAFSEALGAALPAPSHASLHRWRFAATGQALGEPFLWQPEAGLAACGDWTLGGRLENAFLSADALATAMVGNGRRDGA